MAYSGLSDDLTSGGQECTSVGPGYQLEKESVIDQLSVHAPSDYVRVPLMLLGGSVLVTLELPSAMTDAAWQQLITMLAALKPGYVPEVQAGGEDPVDRTDR